MITSIENISNKRKSRSISRFLLKTFDLLNQQQNKDVVKWAASGIGFVVLNQDDFSKIVLPKYFKHSNYSSFVRQLNMYNFHKIRESSTQSYFHHEYFDRNDQNALADIKRKPEKKKRKNIEDQEQSEHQKIQETVKKPQNKEISIGKKQQMDHKIQSTESKIFLSKTYETNFSKKQKKDQSPQIQTTRQIFSSSFTLQLQRSFEIQQENDKAQRIKWQSSQNQQQNLNEDDEKLSINDQIQERILAFPTKQLMYPSKYSLFPFKNKQTENFNVFF